MTDFTGQDLDLALVSPLGGRLEMLRGICRRPARFELSDNRIDALAHHFVPVFLSNGWLPADDESSISATAIAHVSRAAVGSVNKIAELNHAAGRVRTAIECHW